MPELSHRRHLLVLAIRCLSPFIVGPGVTIATVVLPAGARGSGAGARGSVAVS